jgi:hypothetical protein
VSVFQFEKAILVATWDGGVVIRCEDHPVDRIGEAGDLENGIQIWLDHLRAAHPDVEDEDR